MKRLPIALLIIVALVVVGGCGGAGTTTFLHEEYNFGFVERVAIIPFENLSDDQGAGARATNMFLAELLAARAFEVVEPGEVSRALGKFALARTATLTNEQITKIGADLKVQALFLGTVNESTTTRSAGGSVSKVSMTIRMVETERGETIWTSSATAGGRGFVASMLGTGDESKSEVTRDCVKKILGTLID